jgi:hypothetical protein
VLVEQTLWLVGNLVGESEPITELFLTQTRILQALTQLVTPRVAGGATLKISRSLIRTVCWVTHNLNHFRTKVARAPQTVESSAKVAREGLFTLDEVVKSDSLWIIEKIL